MNAAIDRSDTWGGTKIRFKEPIILSLQIDIQLFQKLKRRLETRAGERLTNVEVCRRAMAALDALE